MKKTISFIGILLVVVLFTTGCGTSSILAPEEKNLTCNYVLDEDGYTVEQLSINVDFKKISSSDRSSLGLEDDSTYDQMKETFESQNYTCK